MTSGTVTLGERAYAQRVFSADDIRAYRRLLEDDGVAFGLVPGALVGGMFSDLLGTALPGRGTNWMKQRLTFRAPAKIGERLTACVQVVRLRPEKQLINLRTVCRNDAGATICEGEALVMAREMAC